ncbi:hypothetical protein EV363DRAFT_1153034, partial [Boletus edulis]
SSCPRPMPAHECNVVPPIFTEAMPVDAVIARLGQPLPPQASMMARSRTDFPVPAKKPVKKTFSPPFTISSTVLCSSDRTTAGAWTPGTCSAIESGASRLLEDAARSLLGHVAKSGCGKYLEVVGPPGRRGSDKM